MALPRRPRLIVFDLDFTLWPFWVDGSGFTHVRAPFCKKKGKVVDSWGKIINISGEIYEILKYLKSEDFRIGVASATRQIDGAEELIHHFGWDEFIDYKQIYPGSKLRHFSRLKEMSDCEYHEMLFFDDDIRFVEEVRSLGVFCVHVPDTINTAMVLEGLADFSRRPVPHSSGPVNPYM